MTLMPDAKYDHVEHDAFHDPKTKATILVKGIHDMDYQS